MVKAVISEFGELRLFRAGKYKDQFCPFTSNKKTCGDWCPLFSLREDFNGMVLSLCMKEYKFNFNEVEDKR